MRSRTLVLSGAVGIAAPFVTPAAQAETFTVLLDGISFVHDGQTNMDIDLTIDVGDTVRWEWVSGFHNVVSGFTDDPNPGVLFSSGAPTSDPATVFEYTFLDPGVYGYHCEIHEDLGMVSFVTVVPAPGGLGAFAGLGLLAARRRRR